MKVHEVRVYCGSVYHQPDEPSNFDGYFIAKGEAESLEKVRALFEAAPEMLDMLKTLHTEFVEFYPGKMHPELVEQLAALIAKAEGREQGESE